jgi:hypothetical protein
MRVVGFVCEMLGSTLPSLDRRLGCAFRREIGGGGSHTRCHQFSVLRKRRRGRVAHQCNVPLAAVAERLAVIGVGTHDGDTYPLRRCQDTSTIRPVSIVETRLRRQRLLFWAAWILGPGVLFVSRFYENDWFGRIWAPDARPYTIDAFEILVPDGCAVSVLISAVLCAVFGGPRRQPESWLLMVAWLSLGTLVLLSWRSDLQGFDGLLAALGFLSSCVAPVVALARRGPQQSVVSVPALAESRVQLGLCGTSDFYKWIDTADSSTLCIRFVDSAGEERWRSIVFR